MLEKFERYPLTFGPTHIEKLNRLSGHLGGKVEIYAKRDDCNSGLAFGGNKLRKLEYIIPDALCSGADTLVSIGGVQSNHTRMIAAVAAKMGSNAGWYRRAGCRTRTPCTTASATSCSAVSWAPRSRWSMKVSTSASVKAERLQSKT